MKLMLHFPRWTSGTLLMRPPREKIVQGKKGPKQSCPSPQRVKATPSSLTVVASKGTLCIQRGTSEFVCDMPMVETVVVKDEWYATEG